MENHEMTEIKGGALENKGSFFKHVFNMTPEGNAELLNIIQYSIVGLIPVLILNKLVHNYIPDVDEDKSSLELLVEILANKGIDIARRTVAKYRKLENIPSSFARKRRNIIDGLTN